MIQQPPKILDPIPSMAVFTDESRTYQLRIYRLPDGRMGCTFDIARLSSVADHFLTEEESREFLIQCALNTLATIGESICSQVTQHRLREMVPTEAKVDGLRKDGNGKRRV